MRASTYVILAGILLLGLVAAGVKHTLTDQKPVVSQPVVPQPKIIYKDREVVKEVVKVVYKVPDKWIDPINAKDICHGSRPVQIIKLDVTTEKKGDKEETTSWLVVRPVGSGVNMTCAVSGYMKDFWEVGSIISITQGTAW